MKEDKAKSVFIIGGGLGGLFSGAILAKKGYQVTVFEKNKIIGGGLQTFCRHGVNFETGMHSLGCIRPGGSVYKICNWLGIMDKIEVRDVDSDCMDQITYMSDGITYRIPEGKESFIHYFQDLFPEEAEGIRAYVEKLYSLVDEIDFFYLRTESSHVFNHDEMFYWPADKIVAYYLKNPKLCDVISYMNPMFGGVAGHTPGYISALIYVLYINGPSRFVGGSQQLAEALAEVITSYGGKVKSGCEVVGMDIEDRLVKSLSVREDKGDIVVSGSEDIQYICAIHPLKLLQFTDSKAFTHAFRTRVAETPQSYSTFCVYIILKQHVFPYINHTCYYQQGYGKVWNFGEYDSADWPRGFMYMTPCECNQGEWATKMIINCPMPYSTCAQWANTYVGHRGAEYEVWKQKHIDRIMRTMENLYPGFKDMCLYVYASSPLTIRDFYGEPEGALYGMAHDCENMAQSQISVFTKVRNLLMTGQNVNLHGFAGVPLTAINTAEAIVGLNQITNEINEAYTRLHLG